MSGSADALPKADLRDSRAEGDHMTNLDNDPVITMVETHEYGSADGAWFYDAVMDNMPPGPVPKGYLFHFAGTTTESFAAISGYDNRAVADENFASRTAVAIPEAIKKTGLGLDLTRDLFALDSYAIGPEAKQFLGLHQIRNGEATGYVFEAPNIFRRRFAEVAKRTGFPAIMPPGMLLQIFFQSASTYRIYDIWTAGAESGSYYEDKVKEAVANADGATPDEFDQVKTRLVLHGLSFSTLALSERRRYSRELDDL